MWVRLQNNFFLPSTKSSIITLQSDLYNMKKGSYSVSQYLRRLKEARDGLSVLGVTFDDEDFVIIALNGLPAKYNTFKSVIRGRESVISLEDFRAQLLAEEAIVDCVPVPPFLSAMVSKSETKGVIGSLPSLYHNSLPPEITTCQICSKKGHLATHCSAQTTSSSITQDSNLEDQVRVSDSMESIETNYVMVNFFFHFLESSLPFNSTTGDSISASKQNDRDKTIIMKTKEQPTSYVDAEKQVLECIDKESADSQLISVGLQLCIQVIFPVLNFDNKVKIGVLTQTVVHEFRGFYVLRLWKGESIFDIQLGYHMGICDKGGGTCNLTLQL
ncbi:hypothetical protein C1H46_031974 [Malus baccata]|uniref:CCHC-type domain-containing protein n=1 Tax=Malus baccata TaxID=106549 RepID=A0A540L7K1_MALBA|nr:hypothetical protein C1H46_031974 [Malus baccata]